MNNRQPTHLQREMDEIKPFDLLESPLQGTNLIEASAGTGKTHTISGLFLRLILEKRLLANEILVVTFTVAATEELKDRIRRLLREAIKVFSEGPGEDDFLDHLRGKFTNPKDSLIYLKEALRNFDEAAIFTIHGFCQRMLKEHAFESNILFDTELITEQETLKQEIIDDFWRTHFYQTSPLFVHHALSNQFTPDRLLGLVGKYADKPLVKVIPQVNIPDTRLEEKEFREAFDETGRIWLSSKAEVEEILTRSEGLNRNAYRKASIPNWIDSMDYYLASGGNNPELFDQFKMFTKSEIAKATKINYQSPRHQFFDCCELLKKKEEALSRVYDQRLLGLKNALFVFLQKELSERKQRKNLQSFHDLLIKLRNALEDKGGDELARAIRAKYRAALIDEFQDTDPIQYAIFTKVFQGPDRILFLIGDPKQAIYSFRGADIFAYLNATAQVDMRYTLQDNWRSHPALIKAISTIFSRAENPFIFDEIQFKDVSASPNRLEEPFLIGGKIASPFKFWFLDARTLAGSKLTGREKFIKKPDARELILRAVGAEILHLLNLGKKNKALLGQKPIKEQDIAVLVRTNREASLMQKVLTERNIPGVLYSTGNLFDAEEAVELERVLMGILEPNNERLIRAALTTDIVGISGEELEELMEDDAAWEMWLGKFRDYHEIWRKHNFIRMFRYFIAKEQVRSRLLSFLDGERRLTNILHLSEVLHQEAIGNKLTMSGLLKWLSEQINPELSRLEEHQLRLENDEYAVKIVTIHRSKGLEYPIVFCPFLWDSSRIRKSVDHFTFHDLDDQHTLTLDCGSERKDKNRALSEKESLAENIRLLYVALTRAKNLCYTVWGRFNEAGTSALAYLLHQPVRVEAKKVLDAIESSFKALTNDEVKEALKNLEEKAEGSINLQDMPRSVNHADLKPAVKKEELSVRAFSGRIDQSWKVSSFSSLVAEIPPTIEHSLPAFLELPDYDQESGRESILEEEPSGIFAFPRGTKAGTFMHDLFEHLDFAGKDEDLIKQLVADKLKQYGFDLSWQETIWEMVQKVLSVPLNPEQKGLTLSCIPEQDKISELEFYFPLKLISPDQLKNIFSKGSNLTFPAAFPGQMERLFFSPVRGFMKGFIDLIFLYQGSFYLVDWKSNFLGCRVEDYKQDVLAQVMDEEFYFLQYHLYTVALDQYLSKRVPGYHYNTHFGGVYYLFLRGITPEKGSQFGVYRARPSEVLIRALSQNLIASPEV